MCFLSGVLGVDRGMHVVTMVSVGDGKLETSDANEPGSL